MNPLKETQTHAQGLLDDGRDANTRTQRTAALLLFKYLLLLLLQSSGTPRALVARQTDNQVEPFGMH